MKAVRSTIPVVLSVMIALMAGCSKQEEAPPAQPAKDAVSSAKDTATSAVAKAEKAASDAAAQVKETANNAVAEAQKAASNTVAAATPDANGLIDKVKSLVAEKKYTEALDELKKLGDLKLTPEQQKMVDDIKAQIQQAMGGASATVDDAAKKAGDALGGMVK